MTYRIETMRRAGETVIVFSGLLDESAFAELATCLTGSMPAQLVLATGTEVTHGAMTHLRKLTVAVHAESPFLAAWLRSTAEPKG